MIFHQKIVALPVHDESFGPNGATAICPDGMFGQFDQFTSVPRVVNSPASGRRAAVIPQSDDNIRFGDEKIDIGSAGRNVRHKAAARQLHQFIHDANPFRVTGHPRLMLLVVNRVEAKPIRVDMGRRRPG